MIRGSFRFTLLALIGFLAAACSSSEKKNAVELADTETVLSADQQVIVDEALAAEPLQLPAPLRNTSWAQAGGTATHALQHVAAPQTLRRAWRIHAASGKAGDAPITSQPVVSDGRIFMVDAVAQIQAFDADSGKRIWKTVLTPNVRDPKVRRYNIFARVNPANLGFGGGAAVEGGRLFITSGFGFVAALDPETGELLWQTEAPGPLRNPPAVGNGLVIAVTISNEVIALSQETGRTVWTYESFEEKARYLASAAPAIDDDSVIVPFSSGEVASLNASTGRIQWQATISRTSRLNALSSLGDVAGSPVVDRGAVFAVTQSGQMTGIDARTGQVAWEQPVGGYHTPWIADDTLFVVSNRNLLTAVNFIDGRVRWTNQLPLYKNEKKRTNRIVWAGPVLAGGQLYLTSTTGDLIAVSPENGEMTQDYNLKDGSTVPPVVVDETLYVLTESGHIEAFRGRTPKRSTGEADQGL
ncbi:MAG: PQQ-binding-like beta-propeller repeat protein [Pseudomonadota bacterium]